MQLRLNILCFTHGDVYSFFLKDTLYVTIHLDLKGESEIQMFLGQSYRKTEKMGLGKQEKVDETIHYK